MLFKSLASSAVDGHSVGNFLSPYDQYGMKSGLCQNVNIYQLYDLKLNSLILSFFTNKMNIMDLSLIAALLKAALRFAYP